MAKSKKSDFVSHDEDPLLSYTEAGELVGRSNTTIKRWVDEGLIRKVEDPSGLPRVRKSELARFYGATALADMDAERAERDEQRRREIMAKMKADDDRLKTIDQKEDEEFRKRYGLPDTDGAVEATLVEETESDG